MLLRLFLVLLCSSGALSAVEEGETGFQEENWGDGLKVLVTYRPKSCTHRAQQGDVIHYHYVGRLASDGTIFGKSFDYNSPYIVALGQGRIIEGMDRGLVGTCLWERRRITFPPELGYGQRGAGALIPPNATLVFYIRMIKIERSGESLGIERRFTDTYKSAMDDYNEEIFDGALDKLEEVVVQYGLYVNKTLECFARCKEVSAESALSSEEKEVVGKFEKEFPFAMEYLNMAVRSKCVRSCKEDTMSYEMRTPNPATLQSIRNRRTYAYLHYCHFKQGNIEEAGKCAFSHFFKEPNDQYTKRNIPLYRRDLDLKDDEFVWREEAPGVKLYHKLYLEGDQAYQKEEWSLAIELFQRSLKLLLEDLQNCYYLCEDVQFINFTSSKMTKDKAAILNRFFYTPDAKEYGLLMEDLVMNNLQCRQQCWVDIDAINDTFYHNTLTNILNYLQYCNYQVNKYEEAVRYAATYVAMRPSEEQMAKNINFYKLNVKVDEEYYVPMKELTELQERHSAEERLLLFSKKGEPVKKMGIMGDEHSIMHSEL